MNHDFIQIYENKNEHIFKHVYLKNLKNLKKSPRE